MTTALIFAVVVLLLLVAGFVWGYVRIRKRQADAIRHIMCVTAEEVPALAVECLSVFQSKLGKNLNLDDVETAVSILDESLEQKNRMGTMTVFERPGHPGWFVKPMGAFLGELIRKHADGRWTPADGGGLAMVIGEEPNQMTIHPFDKIDKQRWSGGPGDLVAYVQVAMAGPSSLNASAIPSD
jgi:hypothetical protein